MESIELKTSKLSSFYREKELFPPCMLIFGRQTTAKNLIVDKFLNKNKSWMNFVIVEANECYSSKILFDTIVNSFFHHELTEENDFESYAKVENIEEFLFELSKLDHGSSYLIVIKNAEKLRDMEFNILNVLMRLREITRINISTLFESHLPWEKLGIPPIPSVYVPNQTKNDIVELLIDEYGTIYNDIVKAIEADGENVEEKMGFVVYLDHEFYKQFLNIFLNVTFKMCRDYDELAPLAVRYYKAYCTPVINGEIKFNDVINLWKNISSLLKISINVQNISMRDLEKDNMEVDEQDKYPESQNTLRTFAQNLELPYYAKYLLIASFLASHNDAKFDKRLFMKHHGKERKRVHKPTVRRIGNRYENF